MTEIINLTKDGFETMREINATINSYLVKNSQWPTKIYLGQLEMLYLKNPSVVAGAAVIPVTFVSYIGLGF